MSNTECWTNIFYVRPNLSTCDVDGFIYAPLTTKYHHVSFYLEKALTTREDDHMDFNDFVRALDGLKKSGWVVVVVESPCARFPTDHSHLRLRLRKPKREKLFTPVEAVVHSLRVKSEAGLYYSDPGTSLHSIEMAGEFLDWIKYGYEGYVYARHKIMMALGVSEEEILKLAPVPRG